MLDKRRQSLSVGAAAVLLASLQLWGGVESKMTPTAIPIGELASSGFSPLSCYNENAVCTSFVAKNYDLTNTKVIIPCDECVEFDAPEGDITTFAQGLDIQGKLVFPSNAKGTIRTPFVHVQGVLEIRNNEKVTDTPSLTFILTGTADNSLIPNAENSDACSGGGCPMGKKSMVVAGGKLDIQALPENCPTWVPLLDIIPDTTPSTSSSVTDYPKLPLPPSSGCSRFILAESFESGVGLFKSSLGASGSILASSDTSSGNYYRVTDRTRTWQGAFVSIPPYLRDCVLSNQAYLVKAKYRLSTPDNSTSSKCQEDGTNCISLTLHSHDGTDITFRTLFETPASGRSSDNTWTDFHAVVEFTSDEISATSAKYQMLYFSGPEAGIDIDIDDVEIMLPWEDHFPDPSGDVCSELIVNGNAQADNVLPYPFQLDSTSRAYLSVQQDTDNNNNYFSIAGRSTMWTSITHDLTIGCINSNSVYKFKVKVRVNAIRDIIVRMTLKTFKADGGELLESIGVCPKTSKTIGWVECESDFMFKDVHATATKIVYSFVVEDELYAVIDYDDVSVTLASTPIQKLVVSSDVASCWDTGATILQTSSSLHYTDHQVTEIASIEQDSQGRTVLTLTDSLPKPTTSVDDAKIATEIALLSRNVLITGDESVDDPVNPQHGATLTIVKTPNVAQTIEGVRLHKMGQQGNLHKYPLNFHLSGDMSGSKVSKNSITDSNQRCIVLQGTDNVAVGHNVAYNTFGHCYVLQDGIEQGNTLTNNLGAVQKAIPDANIIGIAESDMFPATFWVSNPNNALVGNVASGSDESGFWYELLDHVRGPSKKLDQLNINPSTMDLGIFQDNVAHSNVGEGFKTYPNGYSPTNSRAMINNFKSYRNGGNGNLLRSASNIGIKGGYYADNRKQIDIDEECSDITIEDVTIHGLTPLYHSQVMAGKYKSHCPAWRSILGIEMHSHLDYPASKGFSIKNVQFDHFDDDLQGCVDSAALVMDSDVRAGHFNAYTTLQDITFGDNVDKFSACSLTNDYKFGRDLAIHDKSGNLNPNQNGTSTIDNSTNTAIQNGPTPGWIVSTSSKMTAFTSNCVEMTGACASYCEGENLCLRAINFAVPPSPEYNDLVLEVDDQNGSVTNFYGYFQNFTNEGTEDIYENYLYQRRIYFTAILPGVRQYNIQFKKSGAPFWPQFTEMEWGPAPECAEHPDEKSVTLIKPEVIGTECDSLIHNPGGEDGYHSFWVHTGGGVQVTSDNVNSGSYAISSVSRSNVFHGPGQFLDTRCLQFGQQWEVMMSIGLLTGDSGSFVTCNPNTEDYLGYNACPRVSFRIKGEDGATSYAYPIAKALTPWQENDWNKLYGVFTVTETMSQASSILMFVERARPGLNIVVDDVTIQQVTQGCSMPIYNTDFETGDTRFWYPLGPSEIEIHSGTPGGFQGTYALRSTKRVTFWSSMAQDLNRECMILGNDYGVSTMFYILNGSSNDNAHCNPLDTWGSGEGGACPTMSLKIVTGGIETNIDIGSVTPNYDNSPTAWNEIFGSFVATQQIMDADKVTLYFRKFSTDMDLIIDDVTIIDSVPQDPNQLINNGDFASGDPRYFNIYNGKWDTIQVTQPGYDGEDDYALSATAGGVSQFIDNSVLVENRLYKFKAQVQLFNDQSRNDTFICNPTSNLPAIRCPTMSLRAQNMKESPFFRIVAAAPIEWTNATDGWNLYEAAVEMMEYERQADSLHLVIDGQPSDVNMVVDNIELRLVDHLSEAPTIGPTRSPSFAPSPSGNSASPSLISSRSPSLSLPEES